MSVIFVRKKQISLLKDKLIKKHFFFSPEVKLQCLCFDFLYTFYVMVCYICAKETNFFVEGQINKEALMNYKLTLKGTKTHISSYFYSKALII